LTKKDLKFPHSIY